MATWDCYLCPELGKHMSMPPRAEIQGWEDGDPFWSTDTNTLTESSWITSKQNHYIKEHKGSDKVTTRNTAKAECFILILNRIRILPVEYFRDTFWQNIFILLRQHLLKRSRKALANTGHKADSLQSLAVEQCTRLQKDARWHRQSRAWCLLLHDLDLHELATASELDH